MASPNKLGLSANHLWIKVGQRNGAKEKRPSEQYPIKVRAFMHEWMHVPHTWLQYLAAQYRSTIDFCTPFNLQ